MLLVVISLIIVSYNAIDIRRKTWWTHDRFRSNLAGT